jgi:hypothetical protein
VEGDRGNEQGTVEGAERRREDDDGDDDEEEEEEKEKEVDEEEEEEEEEGENGKLRSARVVSRSRGVSGEGEERGGGDCGGGGGGGVLSSLCRFQHSLQIRLLVSVAHSDLSGRVNS